MLVAKLAYSNKKFCTLPCVYPPNYKLVYTISKPYLIFHAFFLPYHSPLIPLYFYLLLPSSYSFPFFLFPSVLSVRGLYYIITTDEIWSESWKQIQNLFTRNTNSAQNVMPIYQVFTGLISRTLTIFCLSVFVFLAFVIFL